MLKQQKVAGILITNDKLSNNDLVTNSSMKLIFLLNPLGSNDPILLLHDSPAKL